MSNLYELKENYKRLSDMLYEEDIDEQCILDTLEGIEGEIEDKADNYAKIIQDLIGDANKVKEEKIRLEARQKMFEDRIDILKNRLKEMMEETGKTKFATELFSFNICNNGGKQPVEYSENININELEKRFTKLELNKDEVRVALEDGEYLKFAKLLDRGTHLRIK